MTEELQLVDLNIQNSGAKKLKRVVKNKQRGKDDLYVRFSH